MTEKRITSIAKNTKETSGKRKIKRSYSSLKVSTEYKEWRKHVYRNCRYLFQICYPGDIYLAVEKIKEIKFDNFTFILEVI